MRSQARKLLEDMTALGFNPFDPETAFMGLQSLIAQISPVAKGVHLESVDLDTEEGCIRCKLLADSKVVWLYFYTQGGFPVLGVDYDNDDDVDVEFDLEDLDPPIYDGLIDLGSIDTWMDQEVLQDILFNDLIPEQGTAGKTDELFDNSITDIDANEEESLDDWEGSGSDGSGTPNEGKALKRRVPNVR
jgi:hypothetical protein